MKYSIDACRSINKQNVYISTRNKLIKDYAKKNKVKVINRPKELDSDYITVNNILFDAKKKLKENFDVFIFINAFNPFVNDELIKQGINNLKLFNCDNVISVYEDLDLHYKEDSNGLKKLMKRNHSQLRIDRETLYVDARMFRIVWSEKIIHRNRKNNLKLNTGKVLIPRSISLNIRSSFDFWLAEKILNSNNYKNGGIL